LTSFGELIRLVYSLLNSKLKDGDVKGKVLKAMKALYTAVIPTLKDIDDYRVAILQKKEEEFLVVNIPTPDNNPDSDNWDQPVNMYVDGWNVISLILDSIKDQLVKRDSNNKLTPTSKKLLLAIKLLHDAGSAVVIELSKI